MKTLLLVKALLVLLLIGFGPLRLAPDEAQYWTWSQALDFGYYSKPPAVAWQIFLTSSIFGNNELGVRVGSLVLSLIFVWTIYRIALLLHFSKRCAFWAALCATFSPLGFFLSFAATTDAGVVTFLTLAIAALLKEKPCYLRVGLWIMCAALYKWVAFLFWPFVFIFLIFSPKMRKKSLIWGVLISLLAFAPTLYWNMFHDFATFKHVYKTVEGGKAGGNFFDFLGAQIALLSPIYFGLLVASYVLLERSNKKLLFCALLPLGVLGYLIASLFTKMQSNWALYLYPTSFLLMSYAGCRGRAVWLKAATVLSLAGVFLALAIPYLQSKGIAPIPYSANPFRQNLGWDRLGGGLRDAGYDPKIDFLFADKYQMASLLSFYSEGKKRAYFFNISNARKNQFSYWPQMRDEQMGRSGYFVIAENIKNDPTQSFQEHYEARLSPYFEKVAFKGTYPLFESNGKGVKMAYIFYAQNYNGKEPQVQESY